jgi:hypothetical protein
MTEIVNRVTGQCITLPEGADPEREQAIMEFASQKERADKEYLAKQACEMRLAPYLKELQASLEDGKGTAYLDSASGVHLQVQFKDGAEWDKATLQEAEKVIPDTFKTLFEVETKYVPKLRVLNKWLKSQSSDEMENIARECIRTARKPAAVAPKPYIQETGNGK